MYIPFPTAPDAESEAIRRFMIKFDIMTNDTPTHLTSKMIIDRLELMREELQEFAEAVEIHDMAKMADALIDLVYFAKGTAVQLGLPWAPLFADVHLANMRKVPGTKETRPGQARDVIKPPGWVGPCTEVILGLYGYDKRQWVGPTGDWDPTTFKGYPT
jgi:predicted HAD superfamily Cof-like phosphohydrolase